MMRIQYPNLLTTWCQRSNPTITWISNNDISGLFLQSRCWFKILSWKNIWWGPIFGPVQNLEIVMHIHAVLLLVQPNFFSKEMITWSIFAFGPSSNCSKSRFWSISNKWKWGKSGFRRVHDHVIDKRFEIPLLVHSHLFELDQKRLFEQFGPKAKFYHMVIYFEEKFGWTKSETACICVTWLYPSNSELNKKMDPRVLWKI